MTYSNLCLWRQDSFGQNGETEVDKYLMQNYIHKENQNQG